MKYYSVTIGYDEPFFIKAKSIFAVAFMYPDAVRILELLRKRKKVK